MKRVTILLTLLVILILSMPSCAPTVTDQGYDIVKRELNAIFDKLNATESELRETKRELSATKSELSTTEKKLIDTLEQLEELQSKSAEADIVQAQYEELTIKYEELKKEYDAMAGIAEIIIEGDIEQAVFALVNQERKNDGLNELIWNTGLYSGAKSNNRNMAETKTLQYYEYPSFQQVFWFLGYGTTDRIANTALMAWKNNSYSYKQNVLIKNAAYGAVAAYKSEEILYITYIAASDVYIR